MRATVQDSAGELPQFAELWGEAGEREARRGAGAGAASLLDTRRNGSVLPPSLAPTMSKTDGDWIQRTRWTGPAGFADDDVALGAREADGAAIPGRPGDGAPFPGLAGLTFWTRVARLPFDTLQSFRIHRRH